MHKKPTGIISSLLGMALWIAGVNAEPLEFPIKPGVPNLVKFTSEAPLETIVGKTDQISGILKFDPNDLSEGTAVEFEVRMTSLDTDNRIRDGHMRSNHLHTDKFPTSKFVLKTVDAPAGFKLSEGLPAKFTVSGDFTCHGVTRLIHPEITAIYQSVGGTVDVTARFEVKLSNYEIPRPQFLVMKLDETQKVEVKFTATKQ